MTARIGSARVLSNGSSRTHDRTRRPLSTSAISSGLSGRHPSIRSSRVFPAWSKTNQMARRPYGSTCRKTLSRPQSFSSYVAEPPNAPLTSNAVGEITNDAGLSRPKRRVAKAAPKKIAPIQPTTPPSTATTNNANANMSPPRTSVRADTRRRATSWPVNSLTTSAMMSDARTPTELHGDPVDHAVDKRFLSIRTRAAGRLGIRVPASAIAFVRSVRVHAMTGGAASSVTKASSCTALVIAT